MAARASKNMKGKAALQLTWLMPAAAVLLAASLAANAPAQSGRIIPTPTPTPTPAPTPEAERAPKVEELKFVPDPNAEKYRLVFATRYRGDFFAIRNYEEMVPVLRAAFDDFVGGLNRAGAQGYRVVTSLKGDPAVVALDEVQYEYAWTHTRSPDANRKPGFAGTYARLAKLGFRLAAHSMLYASCNYYGGGLGEPYMQDCEYGDFFLFERRKGFESPRERAWVDTESGERRKGQSAEDVLTAAVRAKLNSGLYPAHLLSKSEVLLEPEPPDPALADAGTELRVVRSANLWDSDELPKRVGELARQGFRLALVNHKIALMYRRPGAAPPLSYVWLKSSKKEFERELARLQEAGAVFRSTYPDETGARRTLVFEQGPPGARREYRLLRFELQTRHNAAEQVMETALSHASAGTQRELNRLAAEGFVLLALFDADKYRIARPGKGREGLATEEFGLLLERRR